MTVARSTVAALLARMRPDDLPTDLPSDVVVAPSTAADAAEVMAAASAHGMEVLVWGAGSHQGYGYRPDPDLVVLTSKLGNVVDWQPDDLTLVVESGMTVAALEALLRERNQTALLPERSGLATIGGVVAAGLSGWRRLRFGPTRDRILEVVLVTGDGRLIRAGGRVVKNVTGYDIPRLAVGSFGSLGVITSMCLKLWPSLLDSATVAVADAGEAFAALNRPLAVLETEDGVSAYLGGTSEEVAEQTAAVSGAAQQGLSWPEPITEPYRLSLRLPAAQTSQGVIRMRSWPQLTRLIAQHGVGTVDAGGTGLDLQWAADIRGWAEDNHGSLLLTAAPHELYEHFDPWGRPPGSLELQRRVKGAFDPAGISNPGRLPGRL